MYAAGKRILKRVQQRSRKGMGYLALASTARGTSTSAPTRYKRGPSYTVTTSKKRKKSYTSKLRGGGKRNFTSRNTKPIENNLKGVPKKFVQKVQKVINNDESWGEYIHIGSKQLRQINRDEWNTEDSDEFGTNLNLDSIPALRNAAAILWNSKRSVNDIENSSLNSIDKTTPLRVLNSQIEFFFKSTSSHVVNLELYECVAKMTDSNPASARDWAGTFVDDFNFDVVRDTTLLGPNLQIVGVEPRHLTSLHQKFKVKVHVVKLMPGEHAYLKIRGMRRKYDFTQMQANGASTGRWAKGSKSFFFRIINDVTVSDTINRIHAFQSNFKGGVAMRYQTTYRIAPPKATPQGNVNVTGVALFDVIPVTVNRNVVKIHQSFNGGPEADQQVTFYNPPGTTTVD